MARIKLNMRQSYQSSPGDLAVPRIRNENILNRRVRNTRYKMKKVLPQSKVLEVKQTVRVVRRMSVRRKSYYLSRKQRVQY